MEWYVFALLSALLTAFIPIIRKKVLMHEHASEFTTTTYLVISIFFLPLLPFLDLSMNGSTFFLLVVKGLFLAVASLLFTKAARHMEISTVEPLRNLSIVFVLLSSFFFLGESVSLQQGIGLLLIMSGAYFLEVHKSQVSYAIPDRRLVWFVLANLVLVSLMAVIDKVLISRTDVYSILIIPAWITVVIMFLYQSLKYRGFDDVIHAFKTGGISIVVIALLAIVSDFLYLRALGVGAALVTVVIALRKTSTLLSTIIGGEIFHDHNLLQKTLASLVMLAGVYVILF
ncbi:MAG: EamA family transporter [Nanoarchaeota archaeon]|nr:EamA family transporter [Nanoarchaeota archaeon]